MTVILLAVLSYALGSVSFAFLAGKLLKGIDLREHGSRNIGASNAGRLLGRRVGVLVMLLDVGKGFVPAYFLASYLGDPSDWVVRPGLILGVAAILGHSFPIYLRFRGGKAVATSTGVLLAVAWMETLVVVGVWLVAVKAWRMISLASMAGAVALPLVLLSTRFSEIRAGRDLDLLLCGFALSGLVLFRHRTNVRRIFWGTEPRIRTKAERLAEKSGGDSTSAKTGGDR